jgi:putative tryptophan/tyrosine transport system substrate-binding protein
MPVGQTNRRAFIAALGGTVAWPAVAPAQQGVPVIGFLNGASPDGYAPIVAAFHKGLSETGYAEGRNLLVEYRWAKGHYDGLPALAADLVHREVTVIAANTPAAPVAKAATTDIPIVFVTANDPVASGLVASLSRPGGNLTGVALLNVEIAAKRLELLHELVPNATVIAVLINPGNPNAESQTRDLQAAAHTLGLQLHVLNASSEQDFDKAFAKLAELRAGALVIGADAFFVDQSKQLAALALRHTMPAISITRGFVADGGMMSYGGGLIEPYRLMGIYTGRILKGERLANLPVQQVTTVELIINLKTAKALGVNVPLSLLGRANEVIE